MKKIIQKNLPKLYLKLLIYNQTINWKKRNLKLTEIEFNNLKLIRKFSRQHVLLCGYPKSGNTWLRFFLAHYSILQQETVASTITYSELNEIQNLILERPFNRKKYSRKSNSLIDKIVWTHAPFKSDYSKFISKYLLIYRNPLDTLASSWNYHVKNRNNLKRIGYPKNDINAYVKLRYVDWEKYMVSYSQLDEHQVLAVSYEELLKEPVGSFKKILSFSYPNHNCDLDKLKKAIELSSFNSVKTMGRIKDQQHGMAAANKGEFARKGIIGSYKNELTEDTIDYIKNKVEKNSIITSLNIKYE
ncbi:MAG: sulfotransferase domain-containing protein [Phaeodactylibacter sp.]|uniref:sulfotransferase domain-containing protein n=1 Tax=Phaeodactylibacter sp. TaxID=1940289 RepID=UPI0032EE3476